MSEPTSAGPHSAFRWTYEGRAWIFGDEVGVDGDLMPLEFALKRETRLDVLARHTFEQLDPDFHKKVAPGDIVVAGRRFAQGNPHIQGLLGLKGLELGLICESISSGSFRNAVNAGLAFLPNCPAVRKHVGQGDRLRVNFETGEVSNLSTGWTSHYSPLPEALRTIVAGGGWRLLFRRGWAEAAPPPP
ncbi:3-isopropylmalate dehydratase [Pelagibius marinus]|uniref:3-isopropylmalate dehydratase n=1 Tax=Pelagibius marinus TaxID=2762760 RepID=UPI001872E033|nr:3-isopropylmalate dehydratase [Pelagibius marinus]